MFEPRRVVCLYLGTSPGRRERVLMRELSQLETAQLPLQGWLAMRVPSMAWLTTRGSCSFTLDCPVDECAQILRAAVAEMTTVPKPYNSWMEVQPATGRTLTLYTVTKLGWLDPTLLSLSAGPSGGTKVSAVGWSAGLLPLTVPAAPLLNALLFWVPFSGVSSIRVGQLRRHCEAAAAS